MKKKSYCRLNLRNTAPDGLKGKLRPEKTVFLERIRRAGGVGFIARNQHDVFNNLK